ncbi:MAG: hypothetical protein DLM50_08625 [Candidatus Meridianibacter frigidus]|nr:MAG: hypothetical protein DLM50_08625 [Candidatus Eremiobacteraeota bacterium]
MKAFTLVANRLSQYVHWNERQSLAVILEAIAQGRQKVDLRRLAAAIEAFDAPDKITRDRIAIARSEIEGCSGTKLHLPQA